MKQKTYIQRSGIASLKTPFWEKKSVPLNEQPRPQFARENYIILNGEWDYAIRETNEVTGEYDGKITVPFSPECEASGVGRVLLPGQYLHYRRFLTVETVPPHYLLHIDAADHEATLAVNGQTVGSHTGGYLPFSFDIAPLLVAGENEITLTVQDPTDMGDQPRGKQTLHPGGIWYTPQSGIWQTVWAEPLPERYIPSVKITPDLDAGCVHFSFPVPGVSVTVKDGAHRYFGIAEQGELTVPLQGVHPWTPDDPYLYEVCFTLGDDRVSSYFAMRKFSIMEDGQGYKRLALNNQPIFHSGVLDQGYFPETLLTPPSDEAMVNDILAVKGLGMNMLRKHIKVEPMRFYYHCDRLGMLVWQDIVSGGADYKPAVIQVLPFIGIHLKDTGKAAYRRFKRDNEAEREAFIRFAEDTVAHLYNVPSLALYTLFNEGWGQFDSSELGARMMAMDSTRTWDIVSGWHDQGKNSSPLKSLHVYYKSVKLPKNDDRCVVLSEFGGYSCPSKEHMFSPDKLFGYRMYKSGDELKAAVRTLYDEEVLPLVAQGLSATVYTQLSDVEEEINGILTYDRCINKLEGLDLSVKLSP
jgi:hypothetical protein